MGRTGDMELVTGATGYVGARLLERLASEGRPLRALARDPSRLAAVDGVEAVAGDLVRDVGLEAALDGVSTAYYLVHSMEPAAGAAAAGRAGAAETAAAAGPGRNGAGRRSGARRRNGTGRRNGGFGDF